MRTDLDLAALLASRLCHDVVGPVGAIQNGLELMAEDRSMTDMAMSLIRKSAEQATAKLQYARMAYGAAGGADVLDPAEAGRLTGALFASERADLAWQWDGPAEPRTPVKLAMVIAAYALNAVPRGGTVTVMREAEGLTVTAAGTPLRTPPFVEVVSEGGDVSDPRAVQALLIERLATSCGWTVRVSARDDTMTFSTGPR